MPAAATLSDEQEIVHRKVWTREECAAVAETGAVNFERLELIEGDLLQKMGKLRPHVNGLKLLQIWVERVFGQIFVNTESPINVAPKDNPTNEPEPDLIVLSRSSFAFEDVNPGPEDIQLVVEVSYSTLSFDLGTKARLYARAGIAEYWVLDVPGRRLVVHREPRPEGRFDFVKSFSEGESVAPLAAPGSALKIGDLFARPVDTDPADPE
jgi:Uma2 family endonuclease